MSEVLRYHYWTVVVADRTLPAVPNATTIGEHYLGTAAGMKELDVGEHVAFAHGSRAWAEQQLGTVVPALAGTDVVKRPVTLYVNNQRVVRSGLEGAARHKLFLRHLIIPILFMQINAIIDVDCKNMKKYPDIQYLYKRKMNGMYKKST